MSLILAALLHPINDITTDLESPPRFASIAQYPEKFKARQLEQYPDLKPLVIERPAAEVFAKILKLAEAQPGWKVVSADAQKLHLEATATTALLRFVDDIAIDVKAQSAKSIVNMRSRSRVGRNDFGTNYKRIQAFLGQI